MRVLGFGTYDTAAHPRIGVVLDGLRQHGDVVVEVNQPLGLSTAERVAMLNRPWLLGNLAIRLIAGWARLSLRTVRQRRGGVDVVVVGYMGHFDVILARLLFPRTTIALDMMIFAADTARDRGVTGGIKLRLLEGLDRIAIACADLVLVDTDDQLPLLPHRRRDAAVVVRVGAATEWFAARADASADTEGPLKVVFYGLFTPLQGAVTIGGALALLGRQQAAQSNAEQIAVTVIGRGQDLDKARAAAGSHSGVTWVDWVSAATLPAVVAEHDVCLGIFGDTPKAHRVVPNKVYQGAAAGCAIVTSDTPPQRRALGDAAVFVPPADPAALAAELRRLAADRSHLSALKTAAGQRSDEQFTAGAIVEPLRVRILEMS